MIAEKVHVEIFIFFLNLCLPCLFLEETQNRGSKETPTYAYFSCFLLKRQYKVNVNNTLIASSKKMRVIYILFQFVCLCRGKGGIIGQSEISDRPISGEREKSS